ncbi:MAG: LamG domain-containing protein, partial [Capnocytophaga endodontalis]
LVVRVPKGQQVSAGKLQFNIGALVDANGQKLSGANNYAVALKLTPMNGTVIVQNNRKNALFLLSRSFKTKVAHLRNKAFHAIYGQNTGKQESGKTYANDVKLTAWTMQYSIAPINASRNAGLMYPNGRASSDSALYNVLYGGSFLFMNGGLKLGFNTDKGKNFKFQEVTGHPSADKWYHVAVTYEELEGRAYLKMYVNGELMFDSAAPAKINDFPILCFGNGNLDAYVREMRLWSKALTQGQVAATQNFVKPDSDGLELYIPYNEDPYVEENGQKVVKNASTNPNKKLPEKWYIHTINGEVKLPTVDYNTEVEF